jgi:fatty acyl-ACP thioesterase B
MHVLEHYNMTSMTLEYRRECRQSNLLESLTSTSEDSNSGSSNRKAGMEYTHLLRMQSDKAEIVRARTEWKSKLKHK